MTNYLTVPRSGDIELHEIVPDIDDIEPTSAEQNHVESAHQDDGSPEVRDLWVMRNPGITQELATPLADLDSGSSTLRLRSATISRDMLKDVLDTRPTLQMGRGMSMKFRARSAFSRRGESVHSSLPTRTKSAVTAKNGEFNGGCPSLMKVSRRLDMIQERWSEDKNKGARPGWTRPGVNLNLMEEQYCLLWFVSCNTAAALVSKSDLQYLVGSIALLLLTTGYKGESCVECVCTVCSFF